MTAAKATFSGCRAPTAEAAHDLRRMTLILLILFSALAGFCFWLYRQHTRRARLLAAPLSPDQRRLIKERVPLYNRLPQQLRQGLDGKINLFLGQVDFRGCNGLKVTEEMRLTIAAQACLMVAAKDVWYENLRTILIYPGAFKSRITEHDGLVVTEGEVVRIGESWSRGPVILSWPHAEDGAFHDDDGHNVVLHEFAHQLDDLSGYTDGAPVLARDHSEGEWDRIIGEAYRRLAYNADAGRETFLDPYGATAPEEFFAVIVEYFFERPADLKREEPAVYGQLAKFLALDPAAWPRM